MSSARIKNVPGLESKKKLLFKNSSKSIVPISSPKYSSEYLSLLKSAINDEGQQKIAKPKKVRNFEISNASAEN